MDREAMDPTERLKQIGVSRAVRRRVAPNPLQRAAYVALALVTAVAAAVLLLAAGSWLGASTPAWVLLIASAPTAALATLIVAGEEERATPQRLLGPALVSLGISLCLGVALGLLWREEGVREAALEAARSRGLSGILSQATRQHDETTLSVRACRHLIDSTKPGDHERAELALLDRPELIKACLEEHPAEREWSARLVDRWAGLIVEAGEDQSEACRVSDTLARFAPEIKGAATALTSCALDAEAQRAVASACCERALLEHGLTGARLAEELNRHGEDPRYDAAMAAELVARASGHRPEADRLGVASSEPLQRYGYLAGCRHLDAEGQAMSDALSDAVIKRCGIREASLRQDEMFWAQVCAQLALESPSRPEVAIEQLLCDRVNAHMVERAVRRARLEFIQALVTPHTRYSELYGRLEQDIHDAARRSGFRGDDSTGLVSDFEKTRRADADEKLHQVGERRLIEHQRKAAAHHDPAQQRALDEMMKRNHEAYDGKSKEEIETMLDRIDREDAARMGLLAD